MLVELEGGDPDTPWGWKKLVIFGYPMTCFFSGFFEPYHIMKEIDGICLFPHSEFVVVLPSKKNGSVYREHSCLCFPMPSYRHVVSQACEHLGTRKLGQKRSGSGWKKIVSEVFGGEFLGKISKKKMLGKK